MDFDFKKWIENEGLGDYFSLFEEQKLTTIDVLVDLTSDDLRFLSIPLGDQKRILKSIEQLKENQTKTSVQLNDKTATPQQICDDSVEGYIKAAEQGEAWTQIELGDCYYYGKGVKQNYTEAVKWYKKAAKQGYADAQTMLSICYYLGEGVEQNYAKSVKWYKKSSRARR